jgi:NRPS condensation-like uncharacterized protein
MVIQNAENKSTFKRKLLSERIHYRAPFNYVILTARIKGNIPVDLLKNALNKASIKHPLLNSHIEIEENGSAWFTPRDDKELYVEVINKDNDTQWIEKTIEEYRKPFMLDKGPLIRFILLDSQENSDFMIVCHHTICDGISLVYLIRDIMTFLGNPGKDAEPLPMPPVLDMDCFPGTAKISLLPRLVLGHFNNAWVKQRVVFREEDYRRIYNNFWDKENLNIISHTMEEGNLNSLVLRCKKEGITVNSAVSTAFIIAQNVVQKSVTHFSKTGIAANLRSRMADSPGEGMGLFAGGNAIRLKYDAEKSLWILARKFDRQVKKLLTDGQKLYDMLLFNILDQTLIDAVYFHLFGDFENKTVARFIKLLHFDKKTPGLGVTNLGRVDIPLIYGTYKLETLFFVPPNIPGGEKILGVVTAGGRMNLSLACLQSGMDAVTMKMVMDCATDCIDKAVKN